MKTFDPFQSSRPIPPGFSESFAPREEPLVLTEEGRSSAVVIDVVDFENLLEELETLRDIYTAEQQIASGQGVPHELALEQVLSALER